MNHDPKCTGCPNCPGEVGALARALLSETDLDRRIELSHLMADPSRHANWRAHISPPNPYAARPRAAMSAAERESLGPYANGVARLRGVSR
jgi:hypothetical protein